MKSQHFSPFTAGFFRFAPLFLWMGLIFFLSTDIGSAAHTGPLVHGILFRLFAHRVGPELTDRIDVDVRKTAHVTIYTILGMLLFRAIAWGNASFRSRNILLTFIVGLLYAASDEYHQSFVPSRGSSVEDVFKDSYGVLVGIVFSLWRWCLRWDKGAVT